MEAELLVKDPEVIEVGVPTSTGGIPRLGPIGAGAVKPGIAEVGVTNPVT